jgi:hypothetical protein
MYPNPTPGLVPHLVRTWWYLAAPGGAGMCEQEGTRDREQAPVSTPIQIPHIQIISKSSPGRVRLVEHGAGMSNLSPDRTGVEPVPTDLESSRTGPMHCSLIVILIPTFDLISLATS